MSRNMSPLRLVLCLTMLAVQVCCGQWCLAEDPKTTPPGQWEQVVAGGFGDIERMMFNAMAQFQDHLYVAAYHPVSGCEIWRSSDGQTWHVVVGPGGNVKSGFGNSKNEQVTTLRAIGPWLFAGVWNTTQGAELWRSHDGLTWEALIGGPSNVPGGFGQPDTGIIALAQFGERLFVGTGSRSNNHAELWMSSDEGRSWQPIAGERAAIHLALGSQSSYLQDLIVFRDALYVAVGNPERGAEIWRTQDGSNWQAVVGAPSRYPAGLGRTEWDKIFATEIFHDALYAAVTSSSAQAPGVLWRSQDGQVWDVIAPSGDDETQPRYHGVGDIVTFEGKLYLSTTPHEGNAPQVWGSEDGTHWERISDDQSLKSANAIPVLCGFRGALYAGTFSYTRGTFATNAGGAVWRFTPSRAAITVESHVKSTPSVIGPDPTE